MIGFDWQALLFARVSVLGQAGEAMKVEAGGVSNFQPYVFWAYGLVCVLLCLFSVWTVLQVRSLGERVHDLKTRFDEASAGNETTSGHKAIAEIGD